MSSRHLLIKSSGDGRAILQTEHVGIDVNTTITQGNVFTRGSNGRFGERSGAVEVHFFSILTIGAGTEWTNFPVALTELYGVTTLRRTKDLRGFSQWRIHVNVGTVSSAGSVIGAQYSLDGGTNWAGLDNGTAATQSTTTAAVDATGTITSSWATLNTAAAIDGILLRLTGSGGDGAADPIFTLFILEVR